jgi:hypothetical protein
MPEAADTSTGRVFANTTGEVLEWRNYKPTWVAKYVFRNRRSLYIWRMTMDADDPGENFIGYSTNGRASGAHVFSINNPFYGGSISGHLRGHASYFGVTPKDLVEAASTLIATAELLGK